MRLLFIMAALVSAAACGTPQLKEANMTTPEHTLETFHNAFRHDMVDREYECLSLAFKQRHGNMDLKSYYHLKQILRDEHPVASYLFSLGGLGDNIVEKVPGPGPDLASLKLTVMGKEETIYFIRETVYRLEFDEGRVEEDITDPLQQLLSVGKNRIEVALPLSARTRKRIGQLRKVLVEKRWKFLDFSFLDENIEVSA